MSFELKNITASVEKKTVVESVSLNIAPGTIHAIMGPNGSGKSSLANTLAGHPKYTLLEGSIKINGKEIKNASPEKRACAGLFLSLQHPPSIPGVSVANFLRLAVGAVTGTPQNPQMFYKILLEALHALKMDESFARRHVHVGFSGGERKRLEILELLLLKPKYAILDEIDSGLDVDALKVVADGIIAAKKNNSGILLITHYNRLLKYVKPDFVHIMAKGQLLKSGGADLAVKIESDGYEKFI